jgi:hypothetical protein
MQSLVSPTKGHGNQSSEQKPKFLYVKFVRNNFHGV